MTTKTMTRKPITDAALRADVSSYGAAVRSLSPAEYEDLEAAGWVVREVVGTQPALRNGRRVCRILPSGSR